VGLAGEVSGRPSVTTGVLEEQEPPVERAGNDDLSR
jgi:hypothetical protein